MMITTTDRIKQLVRGFYESFNAKDLDETWRRYIATDLINHALDGSFDADAWRDMDKGWFPAFDDFKLEVLDQVAEGDKVVTRYRLGGTHTGEFLNLPATGAVAWLTGTAVDRVDADKIVEHWVDMDLNGFLQRLVPQS